MKPPKKRERFISEKYPTLCGYRDPAIDYFTDVARALTAYLRETDPVFIRNSERQKARNQRTQERQLA